MALRYLEDPAGGTQSRRLRIRNTEQKRRENLAAALREGDAKKLFCNKRKAATASPFRTSQQAARASRRSMMRLIAAWIMATAVSGSRS